MFTPHDHDFMSRALELARQGLNTTTPNPRVGCVIVKDGAIIGEGFHRRAGEPHAEVNALAQARALVGASVLAGATAYVTLEPCNHFGRTPPCVSALIEARVARVVAAMEDPNPQVAGQGLAALRHAGVDVRCGLLRTQAEALNVGFVSRMMRGRPWVRMKIAASLDGTTALSNGISQWITSDAARADGHLWRARACAVLTGIGTVLEDDPRLTVRTTDVERQPVRVLVDSRLELPLNAQLLHGLETAPVLVFCGEASPERVRAVQHRGAEVVVLPDARGKVDLPQMLRELGRRGINELHLEAGAKLNGSFLQAGLVDELLLYLAPSLLGPGRGMFALPELSSLDGRLACRFDAVERIGDDLRVLATLLQPSD